MVMGIAPLMVIMGAVYHWFPLVTGRMLSEKLGKWHFWITFPRSLLDLFPNALFRLYWSAKKVF